MENKLETKSTLSHRTLFPFPRNQFTPDKIIYTNFFPLAPRMKRARLGVASTRSKLRSKQDELKGNGPMIYLARRDIRVNDNWSLLRCQEESRPVRVVHIIEKEHPTYRLAWFYYKGLEEFQNDLIKLKIPFDTVAKMGLLSNYFQEVEASGVIADMHTLREFDLKPVIEICDSLSLPLWECDSHNIVPVWETSDKQEYAARTIRPKINKKLNDYLVDFPPLSANPKKLQTFSSEIKASDILKSRWDMFNDPSIKFFPGEKAGKDALNTFLSHLSKYDQYRNDPTKDATSNLSPWFRHGHLSKQRAAYEARKASGSSAGFIEELVVRGELSDNYTFYNKDYDNINGAPAFGKKTLNDHRKDKRQHIYTYDQFESGKSHDPLWNAAQKQLVNEGKMHGFMRMYWAKKILEWTKSPEEAIEFAVKLNDVYAMDGRDPRGYNGIMWSITGLHDQGWRERDIFGKVRYMNYDGCKRKFDINSYIKTYSR